MLFDEEQKKKKGKMCIFYLWAVRYNYFKTVTYTYKYTYESAIFKITTLNQGEIPRRVWCRSACQHKEPLKVTPCSHRTHPSPHSHSHVASRVATRMLPIQGTWLIYIILKKKKTKHKTLR
jgi:hypothetical protein